jgi:hypothetical protein
MASELVPDLLNGLVAAGTFALASVTFYLSRSTARAAVDATSPHVAVTGFRVNENPVGWSAGVNTVPEMIIEPGRTWNLAQHGATLAGIMAVGELRNESAIMALVRFELVPNSAVEVTVLDDPGLVGGLKRMYALRQGEWYVIPAGRRAAFTIYWGQPVSTWAEAWRCHEQEPASPPPVTTIGLILRGASGNAIDRCDLTFGSYVVVSSPREDEWEITPLDPASRDSPGTAPPHVASVGLMRRSYHRTTRLHRARARRTAP